MPDRGVAGLPPFGGGLADGFGILTRKKSEDGMEAVIGPHQTRNTLTSDQNQFVSRFIVDNHFIASAVAGAQKIMISRHRRGKTFSAHRKDKPMLTLTASSSSSEHNQYIAHITGTHPEFTFARTFVGRRTSGPDDRTQTTEADIDKAGLYEIRNVGRKGQSRIRFVLVLGENANLKQWEASRANANRIADRLQKAISIGDICKIVDGAVLIVGLIRPIPAPESDPCEAAVIRCCEALGGLSPKEIRAALKLIRSRALPPRNRRSRKQKTSTQTD